MCIEKDGILPKKSALIITLGCRVNHYESEAFAEQLRASGYRVALSEDGELTGFDTVIVNTCSVTATSDRKSRQLVHRAHRNNPGARLYVTGCSAQNKPGDYTDIPGVSAVVGNRNKLDTVRLAVTGRTEAKPLGTDLSGAAFENMNISSFGRLRSYIKIEDGCESNCAYCIIPALRGGIRCKAPENVLREAEALVRGGSPEIVLTGIELSAYSYGLGELIARVDRIPGIRRIRLGSLDPAFISPAFVDTYAACEHTMPHFHLSLQSGCDRTLASMRRKYNTSQVIEKIKYMKEKIPTLRLSADVICGFPGESDSDFEQTRRFFAEADFFYLHIFPFSVREGTEAAAMSGQIPPRIAKERAASLARDCRMRQAATVEELARSGRRVRILIERAEADGEYFTLSGHTEEFFDAQVRLSMSEAAALLPDIACGSAAGRSVMTDFISDKKRISDILRGTELDARIASYSDGRVTAVL